MAPPSDLWIAPSYSSEVYHPVADPPQDAHFMPDTGFVDEEDTWVLYLYDVDKKGKKKKEEEEGTLVCYLLFLGILVLCVTLKNFESLDYGIV